MGWRALARRVLPPGVHRTLRRWAGAVPGREALAIVREFWRELPPSYRCNHQLARQEDEFLDWDCAQEGFEGIRAQDVLPLLVERFGFDLFAVMCVGRTGDDVRLDGLDPRACIRRAG